VLWVGLTLAAATLQATRNALSRELVGRVSPALTAWARFAFHLPFAAALVAALAWRDGWPSLSPAFFAWAAGGAVAQVLGNLALVAAFQVASFSQSVALHKLEVVFGALLGIALFAEHPSAFGWLGILLSTAGVLLMNLARPGATGGWRRAFRFDRGTAYALACGLCFALASFLFKEAIEVLSARNPALGPGRFPAAAHTVLHVAWIQVALMTPALAWMRPGELGRVGALWRPMLGIGLTGFLGTLCWFWAFGLTLVAYVRAVGQVEAALSIAIAGLVFREAGLRRQVPAIAAIVAGVVLVLVGCAGPGGARRGGDCGAELCSRFVQVGPGEMVFEVENRTRMPITVVADFPERVNARPSRPLPVEAELAPGERRTLVSFSAIEPRSPSTARSRLEALYGSRTSRHDPDARYAWPFGGGEPRLVSQGVDGGHTHRGPLRHAFDFTMPEGTPVLAAREGVVVRVRDGFERGGLDPALEPQSNLVVVMHADGSFASYGHLQPGIEVREGQRVAVGQRLGRSGATGYAAGPHLHFQVGMVLGGDDARTTIPIRFDDGTPEGVVPREGDWVGPGRERR